MQISTMSVLVGSSACNARCPFCISGMTPANGVTAKYEPINYKNWQQACRLAQLSGVTTILLTGKGEPTLFPAQVTEVLQKLAPFDFPIVEMQTNAIPIAEGKVDRDTLELWFSWGLRTIAISNVGVNPELNHQVYLPYKSKYIDLAATVKLLHEVGFSVRLATVMIKGGIDHPVPLQKLLAFAKENSVEQLSIRPVTKPDEAATAEGRTILGWVNDNYVTEGQILGIKQWVQENGTLLMTLPHGAEVYDVGGQNLCLTNCLTVDRDPNAMRQIIYFPDGAVRYSWEFSGARLI